MKESAAADLQGSIDRRAVMGGLAAAALAWPSRGRAATAEALAAPLRGVNLSHWFAQSMEGYAPAHLANYVGPSDLAQLAQAGFRHVRLPVDPGIVLGRSGTEPVAPVLDALRAAIGRITGQGLAVIVDLHPVGAAKNVLLTPEGARAFVAGWSALAAALAPLQTGELSLEILNEPDPLKGKAWWDLQRQALAAIRGAGWRGGVIANGGGWSGIEDLVAFDAYDDPKVIYTVHCYAPLLFTHQATTWSWDVARRVRGLGWPIAPGDAEAAASRAGADDEARGFVKSAIAAGHFTRQALDAQFEQLARWQAAQGGPPIYVGEFGVYDREAPAEARLAWVRSVREACDSRRWGWALWDYSPSFGLLPRSGARTLAPAMLSALGIGTA